MERKRFKKASGQKLYGNDPEDNANIKFKCRNSFLIVGN